MATLEIIVIVYMTNIILNKMLTINKSIFVFDGGSSPISPAIHGGLRPPMARLRRCHPPSDRARQRYNAPAFPFSRPAGLEIRCGSDYLMPVEERCNGLCPPGSTE